MRSFFEERKVGDWPVVVEVIEVQINLFEDGLTEAILRLVGTVPDCRDELIMSIMMGQGEGRQAFTSAMGKGFREQVKALALVTNSVIRVASTWVKGERGRHAAKGATFCC